MEEAKNLKKGFAGGWKPAWNWALSAALTLLCAGVCIAVFGMRYEVNDDAIISNIAAGAYGGGTQYLVYVNILLGFLLKPFFALAPGLNWFVILLFCGGLFCFARLGVFLLERLGPAAGGCLFGLFLLCAGGEFFVYFHYSRYAGLYAVTGLLLVLRHLGQWRGGTVLGLVLALLGSLLRFQMFAAVGALCAVLLVARFLKLDKTARKNAIIAAGALLLLVLGCKGLDAAVYRTNDGWASYRRLNTVRTEISDFRLQFLGDDPVTLAALPYSATDLEMVEKWSYYDEEVFSAEQLEALSAALPLNSALGTLRGTAATGLKMLYSTPLHLLFGAFLAAWLTVLRRKNWPLVLGTLAVLGLEVLTLSWRGRLPGRVDYVLVLATLCFCAASQFMAPVLKKQAENVQKDEKKRPATPRATAFLLIVFLLACLPYYSQQRTDMQDYWQSRLPRAAETDALAADKDHLYLLDTYLVDAANGYDVWHTRPAGYFSNIVFVGSWLMGSPFQEEVLQNYGLQNPYRDAIGNESVLLADFYYRELKEDYLREHHDPGAAIEFVEERGDFNLYQILPG